jgi:hypothetical protein
VSPQLDKRKAHDDIDLYRHPSPREKAAGVFDMAAFLNDGKNLTVSDNRVRHTSGNKGKDYIRHRGSLDSLIDQYDSLSYCESDSEHEDLLQSLTAAFDKKLRLLSPETAFRDPNLHQGTPNKGVNEDSCVSARQQSKYIRTPHTKVYADVLRKSGAKLYTDTAPLHISVLQVQDRGSKRGLRRHTVVGINHSLPAQSPDRSADRTLRSFKSTPSLSPLPASNSGQRSVNKDVFTFESIL